MPKTHNYRQAGFRKTMLSKGADPHAVLIEKFGEPFREYRALWEKTLGGKVELDFPIHLDIELNPSCNLMCPMCVISAETNLKSSKKFWMSFENYKALIDEGVSKGLRSVQLNNINEPLIRKDLYEFVAYARDRGVLDIMLSTNGTALTETTARRLIDAGLTKLSVSIDAFSKETYDKIRVGGNYDEVIANCLRFLQVRNAMGVKLPLFKVTFVRSPLNESELEDFLDFWGEKADLIAIQNLNNPFDGELWEKTRDYFDLEPKLVEKVKKICPHPFQRMTIQADGQALLCCNLRGPDLPLGNVIEHGLEAIYNNKTAKSYRQLHAAGRYDEIETCKKCMQFSKVEQDSSSVIPIFVVE
jgi:radical SAM protein with 4Fe4S-binding SPASM domain